MGPLCHLRVIRHISLLAIALATAPTLARMFTPKSDTTTVFDVGGAPARHANPLAVWALSTSLVLPLGTLLAAAAFALTSISSPTLAD